MASHGWRTQRKDDDDSDRSWRRCTSAARSFRWTGRCIYARNLCMTEHAIGSVQFRVLVTVLTSVAAPVHTSTQTHHSISNV